ncbi:MAG: hypothetical protein HYX60_01405 [Legionella longbeachae]|nr:hypothetical protein [Legionella longbeachae]
MQEKKQKIVLNQLTNEEQIKLIKLTHDMEHEQRIDYLIHKSGLGMDDFIKLVDYLSLFETKKRNKLISLFVDCEKKIFEDKYLRTQEPEEIDLLLVVGRDSAVNGEFDVSHKKTVIPFAIECEKKGITCKIIWGLDNLIDPKKIEELPRAKHVIMWGHGSKKSPHNIVIFKDFTTTFDVISAIQEKTKASFFLLLSCYGGKIISDIQENQLNNKFLKEGSLLIAASEKNSSSFIRNNVSIIRLFLDVLQESLLQSGENNRELPCFTFLQHLITSIPETIAISHIINQKGEQQSIVLKQREALNRELYDACPLYTSQFIGLYNEFINNLVQKGNDTYLKNHLLELHKAENNQFETNSHSLHETLRNDESYQLRWKFYQERIILYYYLTDQIDKIKIILNEHTDRASMATKIFLDYSDDILESNPKHNATTLSSLLIMNGANLYQKIPSKKGNAIEIMIKKNLSSFIGFILYNYKILDKNNQSCSDYVLRLANNIDTLVRFADAIGCCHEKNIASLKRFSEEERMKFVLAVIDEDNLPLLQNLLNFDAGSLFKNLSLNTKTNKGSTLKEFLHESIVYPYRVNHAKDILALIEIHEKKELIRNGLAGGLNKLGVFALGEKKQLGLLVTAVNLICKYYKPEHFTLDHMIEWLSKKNENSLSVGLVLKWEEPTEELTLEDLNRINTNEQRPPYYILTSKVFQYYDGKELTKPLTLDKEDLELFKEAFQDEIPFQNGRLNDYGLDFIESLIGHKQVGEFDDERYKNNYHKIQEAVTGSFGIFLFLVHLLKKKGYFTSLEDNTNLKTYYEKLREVFLLEKNSLGI